MDTRPVSLKMGIALTLLSALLTFAGAIVNHALIRHFGEAAVPSQQHRPSPAEDRVPVNV